jgi:hypothetical protein
LGRRHNLTVITDPLFYLLAIPAVTFLGLSKGGFAGLGMLATPLLALIVPPLEAAAILLPILIVQDAISVWTYHRAWSAWNLKVLLPGSDRSVLPDCLHFDAADRDYLALAGREGNYLGTTESYAATREKASPSPFAIPYSPSAILNR